MKVKSQLFKGLLLLAVLAIGVGVARPFVAARGSMRNPKNNGGGAAGGSGGAIISGMPTAWREIDGRIIPPLGTNSAVAWKGLDSRRQLRDVPQCNCFESVNYLTTGDVSHCVYRAWPAEELVNLEDSSTWDHLEHSLRPGDVVEFVAKVKSHTGSESTSAFHAQLCVNEGGLMAGANNEPRFHLINGIPTGTNVWYVCTSRQYYLAAREMDQTWAAYGNQHTYTVVVYRHPE